MTTCKALLATVLIIACVSGCSNDSGTVYANFYTQQGFQAVTQGMRSNDVIKLIGLPLRVDQQLVGERWFYCVSNSTSVATSVLGFVKTGRSQQTDAVVLFDLNEIVIGQFGVSNEVVGKHSSFVLQTIGKPSSVERNTSATVLSYTLGKHSGSHEVRAVLLDQNNNVFSKEAFYHRD